MNCARNWADQTADLQIGRAAEATAIGVARVRIIEAGHEGVCHGSRREARFELVIEGDGVERVGDATGRALADQKAGLSIGGEGIDLRVAQITEDIVVAKILSEHDARAEPMLEGVSDAVLPVVKSWKAGSPEKMFVFRKRGSA